MGKQGAAGEGGEVYLSGGEGTAGWCDARALSCALSTTLEHRLSKIASAVNRVLTPLNIALTRRTTLEHTRSLLSAAHAELARSSETIQSLYVALNSSKSTLDESALAARLSPLQASIDGMRRELVQQQIAERWSVVDAVERAAAHTPEYRTCPLCEASGKSENFKKHASNCIFGGGVLVRHQCPACDVIFGADKMFDLSPGELSQDYEWHYKVYEEVDSTEVEVRAFHSLNPRRDGIYINYGAGSWSQTVPLLRQQGWNVFAYEPHGASPNGHEWLITSEAQMGGVLFDGIFSNNVLEHFRHPVEELQRMKTWMKPGAVMAHATPCYEYLFEYTRFHLFFFVGRSRELLAQRAKLDIQSYEVDGMFMNCVFLPAS